MWSDIRHLGLGLLIGISTAAVMIALMFYAAAGTANTDDPPPPGSGSAAGTNTPVVPTSTPTITLTPTRTLTSTPTNTPTPSPTATKSPADELILNGELIFTGPLTREEQKRLYNASLEYIAPTTQQAKQVGVTINGKGYGSPSLICGPLSLAILQNAGLVEEEDVVPHDFWLLNPYVPTGRLLLNRVFPKDEYEDKLDKTPLNKFDWRNFPLQPGDLLFVRHGTGGNFDHVLVVNRVDNYLRPYSVTNFNTPVGFIIDEVMLYDPRDSTAGIIHQWMERKYNPSGSTGFGGFEVWRRKSP